ncbi:MAG: hypothetical protein RLY97_1415 [Pseudomonadota bacterium]
MHHATPAHAAALKTLIESAYRGDCARAGWSHEADLLSDERITMGELGAMLTAPHQRILIATDNAKIQGCVAITKLAPTRAYLGLLCTAPDLQNNGLGRQLLAAAETAARTEFSAAMIEMTVISLRSELIAYYQRRGYTLTDETRPFPVPNTGLTMVVLEKLLS